MAVSESRDASRGEARRRVLGKPAAGRRQAFNDRARAGCCRVGGFMLRVALGRAVSVVNILSVEAAAQQESGQQEAAFCIFEGKLLFRFKVLDRDA